MDISKHEALRELDEVCGLIEDMGASNKLTAITIKLSGIMQKVEALSDAYNKLILDAGFMAQLKEIINERVAQDSKWGVQNHSPIIWISILTEETLEAAKAALEGAFTSNPEEHLERLTEFRKECIQVAAVALAMVECYDRNIA